MATTADLVHEFTQSFRAGNVEKVVELFAEDATFEVLYLSSVGIHSHYHGHDEIRGFLDAVIELYPDWAFGPADTKILTDTADQAFAEYISRPTAVATGRTIEHLFMGRLVAGSGKIKLLREVLNTVAAARALLPAIPPAQRRHSLLLKCQITGAAQETVAGMGMLGIPGAGRLDTAAGHAVAYAGRRCAARGSAWTAPARPRMAGRPITFVVEPGSGSWSSEPV